MDINTASDSELKEFVNDLKKKDRMTELAFESWSTKNHLKILHFASIQENKTIYNMRVIGENTKMSKASVCRCLTKLAEEGYMEKLGNNYKVLGDLNA